MIFIIPRYFLERSNSAKMTLKRARELFPVEVGTLVHHIGGLNTPPPTATSTQLLCDDSILVSVQYQPPLCVFLWGGVWVYVCYRSSVICYPTLLFFYCFLAHIVTLREIELSEAQLLEAAYFPAFCTSVIIIMCVSGYRRWQLKKKQ